MSNRRDQLKQAQLADPKTASGAINDTLRDIYDRLEALERQKFITVTKTADAAGLVPPIVFAAPSWPVRAVYLAKLYDRTNGNVAYLGESLMWEVTSAGVSIPAITVVTVSATYDFTFEVRG